MMMKMLMIVFMGPVDCFKCVRLCGWVPTMLILEHSGSFLNVVEGPGVPENPDTAAL